MSAESSHRIVNPDTLPPAVGYAHAVVAAPGRTVFLGGQTGHRPDGTLAGEGLVAQFEQACANVVEALRAAGGRPEHLVSVQIYVTDARAYREALKEIGQAYRRHFGKHYPAMVLFEVTGLFDPGSVVELLCTAVIPEGRG